MPRSNSQEDAFTLPPVSAKSRGRRYFFDIQDGSRFIQDDEGLELDGIDAVRAEALLALPDMARGKLPDGDHRTIVISVRDDEGRPVLKAALSLVVEREG